MIFHPNNKVLKGSGSRICATILASQAISVQPTLAPALAVTYLCPYCIMMSSNSATHSIFSSASSSTVSFAATAISAIHELHISGGLHRPREY